MLNRIKKRVIDKDFIWHTLGLVTFSIYPSILLLFITRINGIEDAGFFAFSFYLATILSPIASFGGRIYQVADINEKYSSYQYTRLRYITSLIMFIIGLVLSILNQYDLQITFLLFIFLCVKAIDGLSDVQYGIMQKQKELSNIGKSYLLKSISGVILFLIANLYTNSMLLSSSTFLIINVLVYYLYDCKSIQNSHNQEKKENDTLILLAKDLLPIFLIIFLNILILNIGRYLLSMYVPFDQQGYYSIIISFSSIITLTGQLFLQPEMKNIIYLYNNNKKVELEKLINEISIYTILSCIFLAFVAYLIGPQIMCLLYKINFSNYRFLISITILSGMFISLSTIFTHVLSSFKRNKQLLLAYFIGIIITGIINLIFINIWSVNGALISFFVSMIIEALIIYNAYLNEILGRKGM